MALYGLDQYGSFTVTNSMENLADDPTLTPIEATALEMLLKGDDPVLAKLREQCALTAVVHREFTGAGYVTRFKVLDSESDPPRVEGSFDISDVIAELPGDTDILLFHLAVRNGRLNYLEAVTVGEDWPTEGLDRARLMYFDKTHPKGRMDRNLVSARQQWAGTSH